MDRHTDGINHLLVLVTCFLVAVVAFYLLERVTYRPLVREISVAEVSTPDGPALQYRYELDGEEQDRLLSGPGQLKQFREYLLRHGRFEGATE